MKVKVQDMVIVIRGLGRKFEMIQLKQKRDPGAQLYVLEGSRRNENLHI